MTMQQTILELGSDLSLRYRYFTKASMAHPAKLHLGLLAWIVERYTVPGETILDPMAGIGSTAYAALLQRNVILRDVEPRWLGLAHENAAELIREAGPFSRPKHKTGSRARTAAGGEEGRRSFFPPPWWCHTRGTNCSSWQ